MTKVASRVLILQRRLPVYREAFFSRLHDILRSRDIDLLLVHGPPAPEEVSRKDEGYLPWATRVPSTYLQLGTGRVVLQRTLENTRGADLIIAPHELGYVPGTLALIRHHRGGPRFAYWGHGVSGTGLRDRVKRLASRLPDWWFAYTQLSVDRIVESGYPAERITCVENSVESISPDARQQVADASERLMRELGISPDDPVASFLGSLSPEREFQFLLRAADVLRSRLPRFQLVIVGSGPMQPFLRAAAADRSWLHLVGARHGAEKAAYTSLGRVMLNPGMVGLNVVDAFALRVPMITTAHDRHSPEIAYLRPGINGEITSHDPTAFADAAEGLLRDESRRLKLVAGCAGAAARYTVENMAARYADGIVDALSAPRRTRAKKAHLAPRSRQLRVLVFHPALAPYRVDLFNALAKHCTLRVLFLHENPREQMFDQRRLRERLRVDADVLSLGVTIMRRAVRFGLSRAVARFDPDVVITTEFSPVTFGVIADRSWHRRSFAHVIWTDDNPNSVRKDAWARGIARTMALRAVDGLIVLSEEAAELYRARFSAEQAIAVSPLLQDEKAFEIRLRAAVPLARQRALDFGLVGKRVLLYVGRLAREKRVDRLLAAVAPACRADPSVAVLVVGDGSQRQALVRQAEELGIADRVIFCGRHEGESLDAWYLLGTVFALSSEYEPFGAVVNEALLAGMPVVCTDRAGARVLVRNGDNGCVVDAADPAALASAISEWLRLRPALDVGVFGGAKPMMRVRFADAVNEIVALLDRVAPTRAGGERAGARQE